MGRLGYEPTIQHFSHPHRMDLCGPQQTPAPAVCAGCRLPATSTSAYACLACNFFLHVPCAQMPQFISHPADPRHALALLAAPAYAGGRFNCDACGQTGEGFSYHCGTCGLDIHGQCAAMPLSLARREHGQHPLSLTFVPPYQNMGFSCDLCGNVGTNQWLYRCAACEFDAHVGCATSQPRQPAATQNYGLQRQPQVVGAPAFGAQQYARLQPQFPQLPVVGIPSPPAPAPAPAPSAFPGIVQDTMGQVGQTLMQSLLGGGGGGGGGGNDDDNGGGEDSSSDGGQD